MGREATQFKPGKSGNPRGRPRGNSNMRSLDLATRIEEEGLTPVEYLVSVYRNKRASQSLRLAAARAAAPYVHSRLCAIEMDIITDNRDVTELSNEELSQMLAETREKIAAAEAEEKD